MKLLFFLPVLFLIFYSCDGLISTDALRKSIPGTYIRFSEHEFGTEYDTLVITIQNESASEFKILRKWKYERVLDGLSLEPEYKRMTGSGIYDPDKKILQETISGGYYSFDRKHGWMFKGTVKYIKIE